MATAAAKGYLPKSVLTAYARSFLSRWHHISETVKSELGLDDLAFEDGTPKSWEDFAVIAREDK